MTEENDVERFARTVIENLNKHGFPERQVAFPLERMYEAAHAKGLSFNKVLESLEKLGIHHEKTPEKIIFRSATEPAPASPLSGLDLNALGNLPPDQLLAAAAQAMQQLSPAEQQALRATVDSMTDEQRAQMLEQARKLGLL